MKQIFPLVLRGQRLNLFQPEQLNLPWQPELLVCRLYVLKMINVSAQQLSCLFSMILGCITITLQISCNNRVVHDFEVQTTGDVDGFVNTLVVEATEYLESLGQLMDARLLEAWECNLCNAG